MSPQTITKTGIMLGLGESKEESSSNCCMTLPMRSGHLHNGAVPAALYEAC
jgi:hypothetical protein